MNLGKHFSINFIRMKKTSAIFLTVISAIGIQSCSTPEESFRERREYDSTAYYNRYPPYYRQYYYPYHNYYPHRYYNHSERGGFGYYGSHHSVWS